MKKPMLIFGADHGGFSLKKAIRKHFYDREYSIEDVSPVLEPGDDYPVAAKRASALVTKTHNALGILVCTTGTGMVIAANKVKGVRAAVAYDVDSAKKAREHNDANVLCLPGTMEPKRAITLVSAWLNAKPSAAARHRRRVRMITSMER